MGAQIKQINRYGDLIEVVVDINGEEKTIRRNVLNFDTYSDAAKRDLYQDILGVPVTVKIQPTFLQKIKAVFSHKLW